MDDQKGLLVIWLEKIFGKSWKTSLWGGLASLPIFFDCFQSFFVDLGVSSKTLHDISFFCLAMAAFAAKSHDVTGTNRPPGTGEPGETTAGKEQFCK